MNTASSNPSIRATRSLNSPILPPSRRLDLSFIYVIPNDA